MGVFETMFQECCVQSVSVWPQETTKNASSVASLCLSMTNAAVNFNIGVGVLDFEQETPIETGWWINGLFFTIVLSATALLNIISIHIFLDSSMRSPTNVLLTAITTLDLLTCLSKAPLNIYVYLMEGYRELPSYTWCSISLYINNFLAPSSHGTAFLLNMYLSVQRFVGVKDMRGCRLVGTYKGSITAIIVSLLVSTGIISIYIIIFEIEEVTAISKKVISPNGHYFVSSCRVASRLHYDYSNLFSVYLLLRLFVMKLLPALVLSACNIALIRVSYRTHIYKKRLVGLVGTIDNSSPDSMTYRATIVTVSGLISVPGRDRRSNAEKSCSRPDLWAGGVDKCQDVNVNEENTSTTSCRMWPLLRQRKVAPTSSFNVGATTMTPVMLNSINCSEMGGHVVLVAARQAETNLSRDAQKPTNGFEQAPSLLDDDRKYVKCVQNKGKFFLKKDIPVGYIGDVNASMDNNFEHSVWVKNGPCETQSLPHKDHSPSRQDKCSQVDGISVFDIVPEQATMAGQIPVEGQDDSFLTCSRKVSHVLPETVVKLKGYNYSSPHEKNNNRGRQSLKLNIRRSSAEMRSTVMLLLVTSCTLVSEMFIISLLLIHFLNNSDLKDEDIISNQNMETLTMVANFIILIIVPLNFIFFSGLSRAFRSSLQTRFNILKRRSN